MGKVVLGYWNCRGLGQPIRLLLAYKNVDFEDKQYELPLKPDQKVVTQWNTDKLENKHGLDLPNLPYLLDGDIKLTQSVAIIRYLGRKYGLEGSNEMERCRIDTVEQEICDLRMKWRNFVYADDHFAIKPQYLLDLDGKLNEFSRFLSSNQWITGDNIKYVDSPFYEVIKVHTLLDEICLKKYQNIQDYIRRFEELPTIKLYMESERFLSKPLNGHWAKFGGTDTRT